MTKELYKRYRPKSLERMVGNEETISALQSMLKRGDLPHTLLIHGPSGCGKTTLARILAKELDCGEPVEMNCSSSRGIDDIRKIERTMRLSPLGGSTRVWILDESHQLSKDAQNGALKMLEDTPDHVYFFLCTTDPNKLLKTIRTRATSIEVQPLSDKDVEKLVGRVCEKEEIVLGGSDVMKALVSLAEGSARMALNFLDKIRHLDGVKRQVKALQQAKAEENEAIALCQALMKKRPWKEVAKILETLQGEPESVRRNVLGYARSALVKGWGDAERAYDVLLAFESHFFDSGEAGLARAAFEAVHSKS